MRLFVALELDDVARRAILAEQNRLKHAFATSGPASLKWVKPEHIHLTLVFLGELGQEEGGAVVQAMSEAIPLGRFEMTFGELGVFPLHGAPRVLWLGLQRGAREVEAIQRHILHRLRGLDIVLQQGQRDFHPHVTLARWRESTGADRRVVVKAKRPEAVATLAVSYVSLIESRLSSA